MMILQEIHKWSQTLPAWQQDAIRKLYLDRTLSSNDLEVLYAMAKVVHGIEDLDKRVPVKLAAAEVAAPPVANRLLQIVAIKNLVNMKVTRKPSFAIVRKWPPA
jgi:NADH dehydrogenase FAD-containing subunit